MWEKLRIFAGKILYYYSSTKRQTMNLIIFDTETTGLDEEWNDILQLSWQIIDHRTFEVKKVANYFFAYPTDPLRVSPEAIEVNGITEEYLSKQILSNRKEAFVEFKKDVDESMSVIGHNVRFDAKFVTAAARREGIIDFKIPTYKLEDTMRSSINFCAIPYSNGRPGYKWPKLSELAQCLGINTSDIVLHDSRGDVELTKRCLIELCKEGIFSYGPNGRSEGFQVHAEVDGNGLLIVNIKDEHGKELTDYELVEKIKRTPEYKEYIKQTWKEYAEKQWTERLNSFNIQRKVKLRTEAECLSLLKNLKPEKYQIQPFAIKEPSYDEIRAKLVAEAKEKISSIMFWTNEKKRQSYVEKSLQPRYESELSKWKQAKQKHEENERSKEKNENQRLLAHYEAQRMALERFFETDPTDSLNLLKEDLESKGIGTDFNICYADGFLSISFEGRKIDSFPTTRPGKVVAGELEDKALNEKEKREQYSIYICASALLTSIIALNNNNSISEVKVVVKAGDPIVAIRTDRKTLKSLDMESSDSIELVEQLNHLLTITSTYLIKPIKEKEIIVL